MIIPAFETVTNGSATLSFKSPSCDDLRHCRTIWDIVWSCLVTLFACVWLSVHPNIPGPDDSWGTRTTRRVGIMLMALIAPEFIVLWAARQWSLASKIAKENKEYGWTKTHGFFAVMGGFMTCDKGGQPVRTVTLEDVGSIPDEAKRRIRKADIEDKSKGDVLSKTFAVLQAGWFTLQCISRAVERLPVTELEIATCAFCVMNLATYILWWNKPLNVSYPVRVYANEGGEGNEVAGDDEGLSWKEFKRGLADIPKEVYRPVAEMVEDDGVLETIVMFPFAVFASILNGDSSKSNPKRIGTFGPEHQDPGLAIILSLVVGIIFGAIHCTAWASQFPSQAEELLWRVAAISVTGVPLLIMLLGMVAALEFSELGNMLAGFIIVPVMFLYVLARLTLLVLPFVSLRSLPSGAFTTVDWVRFIPHI